MNWFAAGSGKRGRSPKFSDAAIQFCLTLKNLFGLAEAVLQLYGLAWPVPDFSTTLCNNVSDASVLADLREQLPPDETLQSLIGDGAYDTQPAYEAVIRHGAIPPVRMRERAKALCSNTATQRLLRVGVWAEVSGNAGLPTPAEAWWKPR